MTARTVLPGGGGADLDLACAMACLGLDLGCAMACPALDLGYGRRHSSGSDITLKNP